ncbi:dihydroorotate dehydrogenase electron transfer subunit [Marinimicrococcus flavescens]|uniref:Dihydroorotate dehydrogenase electron transfer subunit n=1 Tax=Marinimicrococcus flavescens TaxID=3031815 RepID=A0AAP3UX82_9PROT|nr:dihydroorotate dehydrogenase electron transfer subunit [Marinimicrococcus flavescens]
MPALAAAAEPAAAADLLAPVIANDWVNDEYKHLVLEAGAPACLAGAGQFFHLLCPATGADQPFFRRPMSTYRADPEAGRVEFLYKVTGRGTRGLATLRPGDRLRMLGPLGVGFSLDAAWRNIVVLGRGVGLATLAPLAAMAARQGVGVTAILSARSLAHVMSVSAFNEMGARTIVVTDTDGSSAPCRVETLLRGLIAAGRADAFFTCGSNRLLELMQRLGAEHGIPGQVALEQQMACGLGMCFCCVRPFREGGREVHKRVCWDGPVFPIEEAMGW